MIKIQSILIGFTLFFIISGCQQSFLGQNSNTQVHEATPSGSSRMEETTAPDISEIRKSDLKQLPSQKENPSDSASKQIPYTGPLSDYDSGNKIQTEIDTLKQETMDSEDLPSDSVVKIQAPQEKIDAALALCLSAQASWEKGDLESALSELDIAYAAILDIDLDRYPEFNQQKEDIRYMISKRILEIYASRSVTANGQYDPIPIELNTYVKNEINRLTGPEKRFFIESLKRSGRYRPYIVEELKKAGMPEELSWLPLIESGFKTNALSPARALGLWQFIPSTGYKFGLNRNYYIDERLDPVKSTQAAILYLKELHNIFGDWSTVLAAYNCGEGRVLRIIRKQNINYLDNFWDLYQNLPIETSRYVPRFLATLHIVKNLDEYGISIEEELLPLEFEICRIKKQIRLKDIAKEINVSETLMKELNPELRYALLPPEDYELRIPAEKAELFISRIDSIKASYPPPSRYSYHRVRRGDTLSLIAKKYHTTVHAICMANNINKRNIIVAGKVLKIPTPGSPASPGRAENQEESYSGKSINYVVKKGDNLWLIARRYNTTTKKIMAASNISSSALHIGQNLCIPAKGSIPQKTSTNTIESEKSCPENQSTYWVKSGDNPFTIAKKYNMSLERLLSLNHLTSRSKIYPGQKLLVEH